MPASTGIGGSPGVWWHLRSYRLNQEDEQDRNEQDYRGHSSHDYSSQSSRWSRLRQFAGLPAGTRDNRRARVGRQWRQPVNHWHQFTEPFRREEQVEPNSIVILVQTPRGIGRVEPGSEAVTLGIGHRSIGRAPIWR
jgi:hypothetical protein